MTGLITVSKLISKDALQVAKTAEVFVATVGGFIVGDRARDGKFGNVQTTFKGIIQAVTADGEFIEGDKIIFPSIIESEVLDKFVRPDGSREDELEFSFDIMAGPSPKSGTGYAFYMGSPVIENGETKKAAMRERLLKSATPRLEAAQSAQAALPAPDAATIDNGAKKGKKD